MSQLTLLPPEPAQQSISQIEIVLPLNAAVEAINYCARKKVQILGWEGWIRAQDGRVGHGNAPQGTASLGHLSMQDAADFCRRIVQAAALEWSQENPETTDQLHFCITIARSEADDIRLRMD
ncbi:hypothetical protein [Burkholderia sp. ABCPW 11]|uniref:hypothetical protein n=1 Tax=Burkholderia sp. ABCPW 11 TaxID=1637859 RepID=UPI0012FD87E2|nr:hypothetical protein [Burkholderia sp. ABCPW 11]